MSVKDCPAFNKSVVTLLNKKLSNTPFSDPKYPIFAPSHDYHEHHAYLMVNQGRGYVITNKVTIKSLQEIFGSSIHCISVFRSSRIVDQYIYPLVFSNTPVDCIFYSFRSLKICNDIFMVLSLGAPNEINNSHVQKKPVYLFIPLCVPLWSLPCFIICL